MRTAIIALAFALVACGAPQESATTPAASSAAGGENTMSEAQFAKVQQGMTAEDVRGITRGLCDEASTPNPGAEPTVTITCPNANGSSGIVVVERGHVSQINKTGTLP